jgi:hypothetical protein
MVRTRGGAGPQATRATAWGVKKISRVHFINWPGAQPSPAQLGLASGRLETNRRPRTEPSFVRSSRKQEGRRRLKRTTRRRRPPLPLTPAAGSTAGRHPLAAASGSRPRSPGPLVSPPPNDASASGQILRSRPAAPVQDASHQHQALKQQPTGILHKSSSLLLLYHLLNLDIV